MTNRYQNGHTTNGQTSEEIRADIEQTRRQMGRKIDTIQDRLDPQNLKQQAQEAVYGAVNDGADAMFDYLRENSGSISTSLTNTVKRNPVPAALVGLGLGWLLLDSMGSNDRRARYDSQRYPIQPYENSPRSEFSEHAYGASETDRYWNTPQGVSQSHYSTSVDAQADDGKSLGERASDAADKVGDKTSELLHGAQASAAQTKRSVSAGVHDATDYAQDKANRMYDRTSSAAHRAEQRVSHSASHAYDQVQEWGSQAGEQAAYMGHQAQRQVQRAGTQIQQTATENPLAFGAVALAVGAAIGLVLPSTRRENQLMGETRDQVMHSAQTVAEDVAQRAQHVAEEVAPKLQNTAEKVVKDVQQAGHQAATDVKHSLDDAKQTLQESGQEAKSDIKDAWDKTKESTKEEAHAVKSEVKTEAEKVKETAKS